MSDVSQGPGWWLASDGRWYPPELAPGDPAGITPAPQWWTPQHVPASSVAPGLATALRISFWIAAGVSMVQFCTILASWITFGSWRSDGGRGAYDTWRNVSIVEGVWGVAVGGVGLLVLVLVIVWSWQAHRAVTALGAEQRWRIGWTIGGWFVCCAALVIPKLVLNGIERAALSPRRGGRVRARWDERTTLPVGWLWWFALIGSFIRVDVTSSGSGQAWALQNAGTITSSYGFGVFNALCALVAAIAGAAYFTRMSERLTPEGLAAHLDD
jgi:hypothetical protein